MIGAFVLRRSRRRWPVLADVLDRRLARLRGSSLVRRRSRSGRRRALCSTMPYRAAARHQSGSTTPSSRCGGHSMWRWPGGQRSARRRRRSGIISSAACWARRDLLPADAGVLDRAFEQRSCACHAGVASPFQHAHPPCLYRHRRPPVRPELGGRPPLIPCSSRRWNWFVPWHEAFDPGRGVQSPASLRVALRRRNLHNNVHRCR